MLVNKGLQENYRPTVWKFLVPNTQRISRSFFDSLFLRTISDLSNLSLIVKQDLTRLHGFARSLPSFEALLKETEVVLCMFKVHRPDISYVQGMSHIVFFLLLHFQPRDSFVIFVNLCLNSNFLFRSITFDTNYSLAAQSLAELLLSKYYPKVHSFFEKIGFCFAQNLWIENVYSLFLTNFPLETCQKIWDSLLTYGIGFVFRFFLGLFDTVSERLNEISTVRLSEDLRRIYFDSSALILRKSFNVSKFEYEFYFIDREVATRRLN